MSNPESIGAIIAAMEARDATRKAFCRANRGKTFCGQPRATTGMSLVIVSPSCEGTGWRLTRIDGRGPSGHTEFAMYDDAVKAADVDYGVDLGAVEFSGRWP